MRVILLLLLLLAGFVSAGAAELRLGIVGCDTSHAIAFTEAFNNPTGRDYVPGGKVVACFKGGSVDLPQSISRVEEYAMTLQQKYGVKMCGTIEELCSNVDAVLLESVDGRPHLAQARLVIAARKPLFIDKPLAASLNDAIEIVRLARRANVPMFSSSSLRFAKDTQAVHNGSVGKVFYAETYSPCEVEKHHPELFWYGIHGVESLFTVMGTGCESVRRGTWTNGMVEVRGTWSGGRTGIYREDKGKVYAQSYHGTAKGEKGEAKVGSFDGYAPLAVEIMKFFQTGTAPVRAEETLEIIAFMDAGEASKQDNGARVQLKDVSGAIK
jgi:predicted dehydrogenase